jgi:hypothetical protein
MYFKLEVLLNKLAIGFQGQEPLTFAMGDQQGTSVTIRPLTIEEKEKYKGEFLVCTASTEEDPCSDVHVMFERLASNLMPEDFKKLKEKQESDVIDTEGRIQPNHIPALGLFPKQFQEFTSQVHHKLAESIRLTARVIRWRWAIKSSHKPINSTRGVSWSFDNQSWLAMPTDLYLVGGGFEFYFRVSARLHGEMEALIKAGKTEPLGHELFLEAWGLRSGNPRSALIIGMSAAEVGFKQCIGKLVPDAEWLANNAPTPPLDKMLSSYLPLLPAKLRIEGHVLKPSLRIRSAIKKGIEARNHSVHVGSEPPRGDDLEELLLSIRDLLYLLDFYCGFEWALEYIRDEVRAEMVREFGLKSTNPWSTIDLT